MSDHQQRHQHGVKKKLAEGIGGLLLGAAVVLLLRGLARRRAPDATDRPVATLPTGGEAAG